MLDEDDAEARLNPSTTPGMVRAEGTFGEDLGERPAADFHVYRINIEWLRETVLGLLTPVLSIRSVVAIDDDLTLLGSVRIDDAQAPVYFARRLSEPRTISRIDLHLRGRHTSGVGIVLSASSPLPTCLGPNVVVPLLSNLAGGDEAQTLSADGIALAFRAGRTLALGGSQPVVLKYAPQSATLYLPGKPPLTLIGANQVRIFERLVDAHNAGSPELKAGALLEGTGCQSPRQAFRKERWNDIFGSYLAKGVRYGYWRLAT